METRITVLGVKPVTNFYPSKTGGAPREVKTYECKCVLHLDDGSIDVGTTRIPETLAPEGVVPGDYMIAYKAGRSWKEDKIVGIPCVFRAVKPQAAQPAKAASA